MRLTTPVLSLRDVLLMLLGSCLAQGLLMVIDANPIWYVWPHALIPIAAGTGVGLVWMAAVNWIFAVTSRRERAR